MMGFIPPPIPPRRAGQTAEEYRQFLYQYRLVCCDPMLRRAEHKAAQCSTFTMLAVPLVALLVLFWRAL